MRAFVFAAAVIAFAGPAFAKSHSHHTGYRHHHVHMSHHRVARLHEAPIISGYSNEAAMRTEASETAFNRQSQQPAPSRSLSDTAPETPRVSTARPPVRDGALDGMIARHAAANGVPVELVRRVVKRESGGNPRASSKGNYGLMQIRHATARSMGYSGSTAGLLDAETNLTYAVKYLAGAYHAAGGNHSRAVALYASGYHGRGARVARARPEVVAQASTGWGANGWGMQQAPVAMQGEHVTRRVRHHRH